MLDDGCALERNSVSVTDEYLANNAEFASTFHGPLPLPPSRHVAVVACMDARLDVYRILGLADYGLEVGKSADFVLLQAGDPVEAIRLRATRLLVVRRGQVLACAAPAKAVMSLPGRPVSVDFRLRR